MPTTLKRVNKKLESIAECVAKRKDIVEIAALEQGMSEMLSRIFDKGITLDGGTMGGYSNAYLLKRLKKGKNNLNKNLVFEGNLRNSIQVGKYENRNVIGFTDLDLANIAQFQEESDIQVNEPIFGLRDNEEEEMLRILQQGIIDTINECFKGS